MHLADAFTQLLIAIFYLDNIFFFHGCSLEIEPGNLNAMLYRSSYKITFKHNSVQCKGLCWLRVLCDLSQINIPSRYWIGCAGCVETNWVGRRRQIHTANSLTGTECQRSHYES